VSPPPPPPAATTRRDRSEASLPPAAQFEPHEIVRISEAPPPPPASPPGPPPLKPAWHSPMGKGGLTGLVPHSVGCPPTTTNRLSRGVTERPPLTTAPRPPDDAGSLNPPPRPPRAPIATTCTLVTPLGTVNLCSAPVNSNLHVVVPPDTEQPTGGAPSAEPGSDATNTTIEATAAEDKAPRTSRARNTAEQPITPNQPGQPPAAASRTNGLNNGGSAAAHRPLATGSRFHERPTSS